MDLFRSLSIFQNQQQIRMGGEQPQVDNRKAEVEDRLDELMMILRPLLANALAAAVMTPIA